MECGVRACCSCLCVRRGVCCLHADAARSHGAVPMNERSQCRGGEEICVEEHSR